MTMDWMRIGQMKASITERIIDRLGIQAHFENERCCLRPTTPDDQPILGPLKNHPDIYLNGGLGGRGTATFAQGKIIAEMIQDGKVSCIDLD